MKKTHFYCAAIAGLLAFGMSGAALATDTNISDLGKSWPNASDVSANPNWHVYKFVKDGVEYIQINDLNGNVLAAFGTASGQFIVLPMGRASSRLTTGGSALASWSTLSEMIYSDSDVTVLASPSSDGSVQYTALSTGDCKDNSDCNLHITSP